MKIFIFLFSLSSCFFLSLNLKCSPQYPLLNYAQSVFSLTAMNEVSHPLLCLFTYISFPRFLHSFLYLDMHI
jgi:hypothetical protein